MYTIKECVVEHKTLGHAGVHSRHSVVVDIDAATAEAICAGLNALAEEYKPPNKSRARAKLYKKMRGVNPNLIAIQKLAKHAGIPTERVDALLLLLGV